MADLFEKDRNIFDDVAPVSRRTMILFFVVDTSGSMDGVKIDTVNSTIQEVLPDLRKISDDNADGEIQIAALTFSTGARWETDQPLPLDGYVWNDLNASGLTSLGAACDELNKKLSRKAFMNFSAGCYAPVIILLSDGEPTDNYKVSLARLWENNWYKAAIKIAIAIGEDADPQVLSEFTGSSEAVISVNNRNMLRNIIRLVSVTSSQFCSHSTNTNGETRQEAVMKEVLGEVQNWEDMGANDQEDWYNWHDSIL